MKLTQKLLLVTLFVILLIEAIIFVPSVVNFRQSWLSDKLSAGRTAMIVLDAAGEKMVPEEVVGNLLQSIGVVAVAVKTGESRQLVTDLDPLPPVEASITLKDESYFEAIIDSFRLLFSPKTRIIRVEGEPPKAGIFMEVILSDYALQQGIRTYSRNIFFISLVVSILTAFLVYLTLARLFVRPMAKITQSMIDFSKTPENAQTIISVNDRGDELGIATRELHKMQHQLHNTLNEKAHLAALGLAVSKIAHDLRNLLTFANLVSDQLQKVDHENVKRFAPKLISALDRAINLCTQTLHYGKAGERKPHKKTVRLHLLIEEVSEALGEVSFQIDNQISQNMLIHVDEEQFFRVFFNVMNNAKEALNLKSHWLKIEAHEVGHQMVIKISDNGLGLPQAALKNLFKAFQGSARAGGTGLGLAIAHEIITAHGGDICYQGSDKGAIFVIKL